MKVLTEISSLHTEERVTIDCDWVQMVPDSNRARVVWCCFVPLSAWKKVNARVYDNSLLTDDALIGDLSARLIATSDYADRIALDLSK